MTHWQLDDTVIDTVIIVLMTDEQPKDGKRIVG